MIGDSIEVTILSVSGDKVRVGIAAPREIGVFRREVYLDLDASADGRPALDGQPSRSGEG
jgi:carbon storage regulator